MDLNKELGDASGCDRRRRPDPTAKETCRVLQRARVRNRVMLQTPVTVDVSTTHA